MPPIKPGRWTVNLADLAPEWLPFSKNLKGIFPFWSDFTVGAEDEVEETFSLMQEPPWEWKFVGGPQSYDRIATPFGTGLELGKSTDPDGPSIRTVTDQQTSQFPALTVYLLANISVQPSAQNRSLWAFENQVDLTWDADTGINLVLKGSALTTNIDTGSSTSINNWYHMFARAEEGTGGTVDLRLYDINGELVTGYTDNTTYSGTPTDQQFHWFWEGDSDLQVSVGYWWMDRRLTNAECEAIVRDPFGLIRPNTHREEPPHTGPLYAVADATIASVVDETDATTDLFESINTKIITDDFNRANSATLGSSSEGWSWAETEGTGWDITGNEAESQSGSGVEDWARAEIDLESEDHYAEATLTADGGGSVGVVVRYSDTAKTGYFAVWRDSDGRLRLGRYVSGSFTLIDDGTKTGTLPVVLRLEVEGSDLRTYIDGELIQNIADTTITGNTRTGIVTSTAAVNATVDNFEAGDLNATDSTWINNEDEL